MLKKSLLLLGIIPIVVLVLLFTNIGDLIYSDIEDKASMIKLQDQTRTYKINTECELKLKLQHVSQLGFSEEEERISTTMNNPLYDYIQEHGVSPPQEQATEMGNQMNMKIFDVNPKVYQYMDLSKPLDLKC